MSALHTAILDLFDANANLVVYDGRAPDNASGGYVVVFFGENATEATSFEGTHDWHEIRIQTSIVGLTAAQIRLIGDAVEEVLLNARPSVSGITTTRIVRTVSVEPRPDTDVSPPVLVRVDRWALSYT